MTQPTGRSTQVSQYVGEPLPVVFRAFLDRDALAAWLAPDGMRGAVEILEPRVGGRLRMSLTYLNPADAPRGKTSEDTDTSEGSFVELIPNKKIVQVFQFESEQPEFAGEMRMTWSFAEIGNGTEVTVLCEDIPAGIRLEDNELGSRQSLKKLAAYVESGALRNKP